MAKEYIISKNDAGQRLDKFMLKLAPKLPKTVLYRSLRKKDIRLNGQTAKGGELLKEGDRVSAYLHSKFFLEDTLDFLTASSKLEIIYEDKHLIVANKPAGLLMHPNKKDTTDSMSQRLLHYLYKSYEYQPANELTFRPAFINRLDRNTKGLVLGAKDFNTLQLLNEKMKKREIIRKYLGLVEGKPSTTPKTLVGYWSKDKVENKAFVSPSPTPHSLKIETRYKVVSTKEEHSLVEIELITGRSHQIRVQMAALGYPLVGDVKYGARRLQGGGQELIAFQIDFNFKDPSYFLEYLTGKSVALEPASLFPNY